MNKYREKVKEMLKHKNQVLIASHQGSAGGNISYNTYKAFQAAMQAGADLIEFDITQSLDGTFFVFHENEEPIRLNHDKKLKEMHDVDINHLRHINMNLHEIGKVETLSEVMLNMANHPNILINIDHVSKWKEAILIELDQYKHQADQFIIKIDAKEVDAVQAVADHPTKFMTIIIIRNIQELDYALSLQDKINLVGIEILFKTANDPQISKEAINKIHQNEIFVLLNAIIINDSSTLSAYYNDDISLLTHPDHGWGELINLGADIIQTDWVFQLHNYLAHK